MADIFITSTLKSDWNLAFGPRLTTALEDRGITCHLPQRDTKQTGTSEEKCQQNLFAIRNSKVLLGVLVNATINSGLEFGYAHGLGKPIVFLTDENHQIPVMAIDMCTEIFQMQELDNIHEYVEDLSLCLRRLCNIENEKTTKRISAR